jgi:hypothetical protein
MLFTATSTAAAAVNPNTLGISELPMAIELMSKAFESGSWTLASGLLLTIIAAVLRFFKVTQKVSKDWGPLAVAGLSLLASIGVGLQTGQDWLQIVSTGLAVALVAVGGREALEKSARKLMIKWGWIKEAPALAPKE